MEPDFNKLVEHLTNPVKCKLLLDIQSNKQATAKQLAETNPDVPQATMYRYLKKMTKDGVLNVVAEKRVRNTIERVYAVADDLGGDTQKLLEENNGPAYMQIIAQGVMGILREFREYTSQDDIDILHDGSGLTVVPVNVTPEELREVMQKIGEIVTPLTQNAPAAGRSLHNLCFVITPPKRRSE